MHNKKTANEIKFDKRQCRQSAICTIVFLILAVFSYVIVYLEFVDMFPDWLMVLFLFVYVCSGPALLYSVYQLFCAMSYLKRLRKHGYEVPENKKDYDRLLERLPRQEQNNGMEDVQDRNKASFILGICCLIALLLLLGVNIWYITEWYFLNVGELVFLIGLMSVVDIALFIYGIIFFRQTNEKRYKDDVEIDNARKNRMPVPEGILTILILLGISILVKYTAHSMTDYVFKSRISADMETVQNIHQSLTSAYEMMQEKDMYNEWEATKNELVQGVDITTWGVPKDEFQTEVANMLGISDFTELQEEFNTADGAAVVYVKLVEETLVVELKNPVTKVNELEKKIQKECSIK